MSTRTTPPVRGRRRKRGIKMAKIFEMVRVSDKNPYWRYYMCAKHMLDAVKNNTYIVEYEFESDQIICFLCRKENISPPAGTA